MSPSTNSVTPSFSFTSRKIVPLILGLLLSLLAIITIYNSGILKASSTPTPRNPCSALDEYSCRQNHQCNPGYGSSCPICADVKFTGCHLDTQANQKCTATGGHWNFNPNTQIATCTCPFGGDFGQYKECPQPSPTPTSQPIPKTIQFQHPDLHFQVEYPPTGWELTNNSTTGTTFTINDSTTIDIYTEDQPKVLPDSCNSTTVDGQPATSCIIQEPSTSPNLNFTYYAIILEIPYNDTYYYIATNKSQEFGTIRAHLDTLLATFEFTDQTPNTDPQAVCQLAGGTWLDEHTECTNIDQNTCTQIGGNFNSCASACRHDPEPGPCIMLCLPVCQFSNSNTDTISYTDLSSQLSQCIDTFQLHDQQFIIPNQTEYNQLLNYQSASDLCQNFQLPQIDFAPQVLLGQYTQGSGCSIAYDRQVTTDANNHLTYTIDVIETGNCEKLGASMNWITVPRTYYPNIEIVLK